jgi:LacI family transcriptional regulator
MTKVRIKDIAEIANVSVGTVDRVIHKRGEVSASTRRKIEQLLEEFNYKPDIAARSLALKREIHLAVLMPEVVRDKRFWELPRQRLEQALESLEHDQVILHQFHFSQVDRSGFSAVVKDFPFSRVEGVLFAPVFKEESLAFLERCAAENLPVILFNSFLEAPSVRSYVGQNAYGSGYVAARLMFYGLHPGSDVAIVNMSARRDNYSHIIDRERGFREYFSNKEEGMAQLISIDLNGADDLILRKSLKELFITHNIVGIFVTNSRVHKVARILEESGIKGIRLVGYDLLPENIRLLERDLIDFLISQKPEVQAYQGLKSLFNLVVFNREADARQWLPIDIITRENLPYYQTKTYK